MQTVSAIPALRALLRTSHPQRIALVPTMGNLHAGHLSLVEQARQQADVVVVSIFVNPLQFGPTEDYESYPQTLEADSALLQAAGVALLFAPQVSDMYPVSTVNKTQVLVPELSDILCGASRPGHFAGVTSVVTRLFNAVQPHLALFGKKDYQQWLIIKQMVVDLLFPIEIIGLPTLREVDGLAMSSRNQYLSEQERALAPRLFQVLNEINRKLLEGERELAKLEYLGAAALAESGFRPDYVAIRRREDLGVPDANHTPNELVILAAAWLGKARLLDNLEVG